MMVKNESRFIWYSAMSVLPHVDEIIIWDTGSTDGTLDIIRRIVASAPGKVSYNEISMDNFDEELTRQQMLDETKADWFIVVDADEVWWDDSIKKVVELIGKKGNELESVVVPVVVPVGDMFHRQEEKAGRYKLAGRTGHYNLRTINRRIPGLHSSGAHGVWGWVDGDNKMIQDRNPAKIGYVDASYLHTTHLERSGGGEDSNVTKRKMKLKHEIGESFPRDYYYPEVFFRPRPGIVESPWKAMASGFRLVSLIETPLRKIKRRVWWGKAGY
jgi:glycosyltransferase involved in cell wall biosynthesis